MSRLENSHNLENDKISPEIKGIEPEKEMDNGPENFEECLLDGHKKESDDSSENNDENDLFKDCLISETDENPNLESETEDENFENCLLDKSAEGSDNPKSKEIQEGPVRDKAEDLKLEEKKKEIVAETKKEPEKVITPEVSDGVEVIPETGPTQQELLELREANQKELQASIVKKESLDKELKDRFESLSTMDRSVPEYKEELSLYNALKDNKEVLEAKITVLRNEQERLDKQYNDLISEDESKKQAFQTKTEIDKNVNSNESNIDFSENSGYNDGEKQSEPDGMTKQRIYFDLNGAKGESDNVLSHKESPDVVDKKSPETNPPNFEQSPKYEDADDEYEKKRDISEVEKRTLELSKQYYDEAKEVANRYDDLRTYSDHREVHIQMVQEKASEAANVVEQANKDNPLYGEIDRKELDVSALWHDTGMDGGKFREYEKGNDMRKDHSLNSAIHALENRKEFEDMGVDTDAVALNCMLHSKSCSGVKDLTNPEHMTLCMDRMDNAVKEYNDKHLDNQIEFDKSRWIKGDSKNPDGIYDFKEDEMANLRATSAALRLGDANRDAPEFPTTQGGERIHVDLDSYKRNAKTWQEEVETANIYLENDKGEKTYLSEHGVDDKRMGRMFAAGEGNITSMNCVYNSETNSIQEHFLVVDGTSFPKCTQKCIMERFEELDTIKNINREAHITFLGQYTKEEKQEIIASYSSCYETWSFETGIDVIFDFKEDNR